MRRIVPGAHRRVRRVLSPKVAFLDVGHDPARALVVAGSARSGTTWLAEILATRLRCRLLFEPFRAERVPLAADLGYGRYARPGSDDPALADLVGRILAGRVRSRWSDRYNTVRWVRRRVVKEIRILNLLPWLADRFPSTPIVYLLRHPIPSAQSLVELGWPDRLASFLDQEELMRGPLAAYASTARRVAADGDPLQRFVLRWCLENTVPLRTLERDRAHLVFYEHLVADPGRELIRLASYLRRFPTYARPASALSAGEGGSADGRQADLRKPSATDYRRSAGADGSMRLERWLQEVPPLAVGAAVETMAVFGLDGVYGADPMPKVGADQLLGGGGVPRR